MLRKSISILLALVMIVSIFTIIPASAAEKSDKETTAYEANVEFVAEKAPAHAEKSEEDDLNDKQDNSAEFNDDTDKADVADDLADDLADTGAESELSSTGETVNGFTYNVNNKEATITAYNKKDITTLDIPSKIGGFIVTGIGSSAFKGYANLTNISIPDTVVVIGAAAFDNTPWYNNQPDGVVYAGKVVYKYKNPNTMADKTTLSIKEGTKGIASRAFEKNNNLNIVNLPSTIQIINSYAFYNCSSLEHINLPDSVTIISERAFAACASLTNVVLPKNLTTLGYHAFCEDHSLTEITIPKTVTSCDYPFENCSNLTKMVFENGTITIPSKVAPRIYALTDVTIPDTVTKIGTYAFHSCSSLEHINLPDSVTIISERAFAACASLTNVVLPKNLTTLGYHAFCEDNSLTEITIPKTVTSCDYPFENCSNLTKMVFENGTTEIPSYTASKAYGLTEAMIPDSVIYIGNNAFNNCSNDLKIFCPKYSVAAIHCIDKGYNIALTSDKRTSEPTVLDLSESEFRITSSAKLNVNCSYSIKDDVYKKASNYSVKIHIPKGASLEDGSLYLDRALLTNFTEQNDYISIPVTKQSGKISFNLNTEADCNLLTYAVLNYRMNNQNSYDIIDVINENIDLISLNTDDLVSSEKVKVSGIAPVNADVDIYIGDEKAATLKANKAGTYSGEITLSNPENSAIYSVKAVSADKNGGEITAEKQITFIENAPELTDFTMTYNGRTYDLLSGKKQSITFILESFHGATPFSFIVKYKNPDKIGRVLISSTRNQVKKTVSAEWNESTKTFEFNGYFDEDNHDYVPGKISCLYTTKNELDDPAAPIAYDDLPSWAKNADVTVHENTDDKYSADLDFGNGQLWQYEVRNNLTLDELEKEYFPEEEDKELSPTGSDSDSLFEEFIEKLIIKYGEKVVTNAIVKDKTSDDGLFALIQNDADGTLEYIFWDSAKDTLTKQSLKYGGGVIIESLGELTLKESLQTSGVIVSAGFAAIKLSDQIVEVEGVKNQIRYSKMNETEKKQRINELTKLEFGYSAVAAFKVASAIAGIAVTATFGPLGGFMWGVATGVIAGLWTNYLDNSVKGVSSAPYLFNWSIDPSGYIFSGVTSNRIDGAKVTAYWIPYDENDEDFWENPDESKAEIWDASEYSQINPLITDNDGNYAWDVPEGLWKVVVEKEGYETYSTDWLPVPPPQTDVNINLISTATPELEGAVYADGAITLTFSQYMDPATMNSIVVKDYRGAEVSYTLTYSENEKNADGTIFAKEYRLVFDESYETKYDYYAVTISEAESYSGVKMGSRTEIGEKPVIKLGDVDGDGDVTVADATAIQRYVLQLPTIAFVVEAADIDGDGIVTIVDATFIQRYSTKFETPYAIGEAIA